MLRAFWLGGRLVQRKHICGFERPSQIDRVGTVFRRLQTFKCSRKRDICAPVENESEYTLGIVANQQDHGLGEVRIAQVPARHQHLSDSQTLGILELDGKKTGGPRWVSDGEVGREG